MQNSLIYEKLRKIQVALKAPKSQFNSFSKFNYRSVEDILEALKPLLKKHELTLVLSDSIVLIGDRYYVQATAELNTIGMGGSIAATAYAREELEKKGMDAAQITGTASSYARKYALNGLFAIDDSKDIDSEEQKRAATTAPKPTSNLASLPQKQEIATLLREAGIHDDNMAAVVKVSYGVDLSTLTKTRADVLIGQIKASPPKVENNE